MTLAVRAITAVLLAVLVVVAILALSEFHYRNCIEAATHATPRAGQKGPDTGFGGYGGGDNSGPEDRALRRRMIAQCSHSPL